MKNSTKIDILDTFKHSLESMIIEEDCGKHLVKIYTYDFVHFDKILTNSPHSHEYCEICLVTGGSGKYMHNNMQYNVKKGSLILSDPNTVHELSCYESKNLEIVFLFFSIESSDLPLSSKREDVIVSNFLNSHTAFVEDASILFNYLPLLVKNKINKNRKLSKVLAGKAWFFDCLSLLTAKNKITNAEEHHNQNIELAASYILNNLDKSIKVSDVAKNSYISERHLRTLFYKHYQMSITDYIQAEKVKLAESKLRMGYKVNEAAASIGIYNASQFSKLFKKISGYSPKEYSDLIKQIK